MTTPAPLFALQARYLFPGVAPPIPDGVVTIQGDRIVAVGENASGRPAQQLGNVAILPGLINAHTHLEFSDLTTPIGQPGMPFPAWIAQVVTHRRALQATVGDLFSCRTAAVARGLQECLVHGTTMLGEIATPPTVPVSLQDCDPSCGAVRPPPASPAGLGNPQFCPIDITVFLELIGLSERRIEPLVQSAREHLAAAHFASGWRPGLSPHAPYTVHPALLAQISQLSAESGVPVAMHLAESREELQLLQSADGPFVELLKGLEAWDPTAIPHGIRPLDYLKLLATAHCALVIHGNYLGREEIRFLAEHREHMSIVYCPRTHTYFAHDNYPLGELLEADANVALGTDSRASSPDLSILAEMRHANALHADTPAAAILRLGTENGARALGRDRETGSLAIGKLADLTVVPLPDADASDPHQLVFESNSPVVMTWRRGRQQSGERGASAP